MILEFSAVIGMTERNALFKKKDSHPVTHESGPSETQVHYLVKRNQINFMKDENVLPSEIIITQHKSLV